MSPDTVFESLRDARRLWAMRATLEAGLLALAWPVPWCGCVGVEATPGPNEGEDGIDADNEDNAGGGLGGGEAWRVEILTGIDNAGEVAPEDCTDVGDVVDDVGVVDTDDNEVDNEDVGDEVIDMGDEDENGPLLMLLPATPPISGVAGGQTPGTAWNAL